VGKNGVVNMYFRQKISKNGFFVKQLLFLQQKNIITLGFEKKVIFFRRKLSKISKHCRKL
jgi:hypothetical protein